MAVVPDTDRHFAGLNTRMVIEHVVARLGEDAAPELLALAGETRPITELLDDCSWSSYAQFRSLLEAAGQLLGGAERIAELQETVSATGGNTPELSAMLQAFGSPSAMYASMADGQAGMYTIIRGRTEEIGSAHWHLHSWLDKGFEPFPELCAYMRGIAPLGVRLFGLTPTGFDKISCQLDGDASCTTELRWDESMDLTNQLEYTRACLELARSSLEAFHGSVADLVASDDLDTVLGRIVKQAARATRAPSFVLALDPMPWLVSRVHAEGLGADEAAAVAERVLGDDPVEEIGLIVEVASTRRRYGKLVAVDTAGSVMAHEHVTLQVYARLAATALDSAFALEESRRQAKTAHTLLELSTALAEVSGPEDLANKVARAMPYVIDCDVSAVVLLDDENVASVAGSFGFGAAGAAELAAVRFPLDAIERAQTVTVRVPEGVPGFHASFMDRHRVAAMATAPVVIDGATIGFLVAGVVDHPERLTDDEQLRDRFYGLAGQAGIALRNGRLLDQIRHQALHDPLTDLPNRALILDRAEQMLARARRSHTATAALFIDLDGFKEVNDSLGHAAGDELLRKVAARLTATVRESDTVGRLGGDEFIVLSDGVSLDAGPEVVAERLLDVLRPPYELTGCERPIVISASIGVALGDRASAEELLRDADVALYSAKGEGKNGYRIFAPEMQTASSERAALSQGLAQAVAEEQFFLVYQPIFDLQAEAVTGVEALLRWQHPDLGIVAPDRFIPLLEESGLIIDVGRWVLREACRQTAEWHAAGYRINVSVNASARQLERRDLVDDVRHALADTGLPPTSLIVEITETAIMRDAEATICVLTELKTLGVRIAIDDFGTGYSSLAYLQRFPVDAMKIDRSFITAIADSPAAGELIRTLVGLGKALKLETLAEGIEQRDQFDRLQDEGCDSGQGFMFARPLEPADLVTFLASHDVVTRTRPTTELPVT